MQESSDVPRKHLTKMMLRGVVGGLFLLVTMSSFLFWLLFTDFVDNYQLGYKFDARSGKLEILEGHGYFITPPVVVKVHVIDLRPMQVCINANQRVLNCKLVQFNPKGIQTFLSWHGRGDYHGPGSSSSSAEPSRFSEILKSYAYEGSGKNYPFLTIIRELKSEENSTVEVQ